MTDQPLANPAPQPPVGPASGPYADPFAAPSGGALAHAPAAPGRYRVPAWLTVLCTFVALVFGAGAGSMAVWAYEHRDDLSSTVERLGVPVSGTLFIDELEPGVCFDKMPGQSTAETTGDVRVRSCTEPHDYQVYATFNLPDRAWPGYDDVESDADERCQQERSRNVALAKITDEDQVYWWTPSSESWGDGDRYVICAMQGPAVQLVAPLPIA